MIIMRLSDGLGNQLFQFAAGEALRARLNCEVSYLVDSFFSSKARADRPLIVPTIANFCQDLIPTGSVRSKFWSIIKGFLTPESPAFRHVPGVFYLTQSASCDDDFFDILDGTFISGYFQSWDCVGSVVDKVREKISGYMNPLMKLAKESFLPHCASDQRLVALHLRLGDYQLIGDGNEAIVPINRISDVLRNISSDSVIAVFTDTPSVVNKIVSDRKLFLVNTGDDLLDFAAMTACDDFIIANSTYSWWASALGASSSKRIYAPRDWARPGISGSDPNNKIYAPSHILY